MQITYENVWGFIHKASKVLFPGDIKSTWRLLAEYISENEPFTQYRLYEDETGNGKYVKINLRIGINV